MRAFLKRFSLIIILTMILIAFSIKLMSITAMASYSGIMELKTLVSPATGYESMSEKAKVLENLKAGETVIVQSQDGEWFEVLYQGNTLYLHGTADELFETRIDENVVNELNTRIDDNESWVQSYVTQMKALRSANIWRVFIAGLIAVALGTVVFSSIHRQNKEKRRR